MVAIIGVVVTGGNQQAAKPDHVMVAMADLGRLAPVGDTGGKPIGNAHAALDLAQQHETAIGRDHAAVKRRLDAAALNG